MHQRFEAYRLIEFYEKQNYCNFLLDDFMYDMKIPQDFHTESNKEEDENGEEGSLYVNQWSEGSL